MPDMRGVRAASKTILRETADTGQEYAGNAKMRTIPRHTKQEVSCSIEA